MKRIYLSGSTTSFTIVDDEDYEHLNKWKWHRHNRGYVARYQRKNEIVNGKRKILLMHRVITCAPPHLEVDHINHNRHDNRKENLRLVNRVENAQNKSKGNPYDYQRSKQH